jgi:anti-anti-sigma factor
VANLYRLQSLQSVQVIELDLPGSLDAMEFDRLNESVLNMLDGKEASNWVLDLSAVAYLGSAMLGLIVNIRQQVKTAGGRLVLCGMSPELLEIFRNCSMERLFTIARSRSDAVKVAGR